MELKGHHIGVIGLGESGLAMAKWLDRQGAHVCVLDTRENPPNQAALKAAVPSATLKTGPLEAKTLAGFDLLALSPGIPSHLPVLAETTIPIVSEVELFVWGLRDLTAQGVGAGKVLAISGSNGKTTTTALTAHLLNKAGVSAIACGNISPSVLDALMAALDTKTLPKVWVVEVSSFQLETTHSMSAAAATVLNLSEDHLDRHGNMQGYAEAKRRIFQGSSVRVLNRDDDYSLSMGGCGAKMVTFGLNAPSRSMDYGIKEGAIYRGQNCLLPLSGSPLTGLHNATNLMAALALCEAIGVSAESVLPGLASFHGLAHRVETVGEHLGILFVDDSKGTNVGATLAAIEGLGRKLAIVLGGDGKGQDFSPLKAALEKHGRAVALIGKDASLIESAIAGCDVPTAIFADMESAVSWLSQQAKAGDAVLLSPACASLDMYRNYAHRADVFRAAVKTFVSGVAA
ncbi:MAG: hypothetical protein RIR18_1926 [Pseudomonadota bacterium]|jgi:UDP-N-acetylmuramoylalanine--D-glutamate ligase